MRRYAIAGNQNAPGTGGPTVATSTVIATKGATTVKGHLYEVIFGSAATPADQAFNMKVSRYTTAAGTSTSVTPAPLDPDDPAALTGAGSNYTVTPDYSTGGEKVCLSFSINQQATFRWVAPPDEGIIAPATATTGLGLYFNVVSGGTALAEATFHFAE